MKNKIFLSIILIVTGSLLYGQTCINNPSIQQGDLNPAPLVGNAGGIISFTYVENLLDYTDEETDPVNITLCLLNIQPVNGATSVAGTFSSNFTWVYDPGTNCLLGTQNQDIFGGSGGSITVAFNQTNPIICPSAQMGFNANIQPAACMNGVNETVDDTESVYTCAEAFPIELSEFTGYIEDCKAFLRWSTASETDFSHFELEKSIDGETFQTIATIQGKGSTTETASYSYVDLQLRSINYYRLKSVDLDGTVDYSKLISLTEEGCAGNVEFNIFPNPTTESTVNIQFNSQFDSDDVHLVFSDVLGRVIMQIPVAIEYGVNNYHVNIDQLPDATYFVGFSGSYSLKETRKFVKLSK